MTTEIKQDQVQSLIRKYSCIEFYSAYQDHDYDRIVNLFTIMKAVLLIAFLLLSINSRGQITPAFENLVKVDTLINKTNSQKEPQNSLLNEFQKVEVPQKLNNIQGNFSINSISEACYPTPANDCGGLGGGGGITPPVLTSNTNIICDAQNDLNLNKLSAELYASGCTSFPNNKIAWFRLDTSGIGIGIGSGVEHTKTITNPGTYFAACINGSNEIKSGRSNIITINEIETPTNKPILINYLPIEAGEEISLMANGCLSLTYEWQGLGTGQAFLVMPLETTNYRVFCRNETCRSDVSSALITVLQPIISSTASEICFQSGTGSKNSATLTIEHCNGFITWSTRQTTASITVQPDETSTYFAYCKLGNDEVIRTNSITIHVVSKPSISKFLMNRLESRLTAQCAANNTVLWSTGASTNYIIVPTNLTQEYTAYCIEDGCSSVGTKLKIYSAPEISADLTRICSGQTVTLTAIGCDGTVSWFSGTGAELLGNNNPQSFTLRNVLVPTVFTYRVQCTVGEDVSPYSNTVSINVEIGTIPNAPGLNTVPNPAIINLGRSVSLSASGCGKDQTFWNTGENANSIIKSPTESTSYFAYCDNGTCPSDLTNAAVTVVHVIPPKVKPTKDTICYGQLAEIKVSGCSGSATVWSVPENYLNAAPTNHGVGNLINIQINENRLFYATCADQGVVSDNSEMVLVSFSPRPAITTTPNPAVLWEGESLELYATGCKSGETYLWDDGVSSQSFSKIEVQNTTHFVQCVNASCSTEKTSFYVRVCPLLQVLNSPENDFGITPMNQPDPSKVIIASNHIKTDVIPLPTKVIYQADNQINLEPGFEVASGAFFTAQIGGCFVPQGFITDYNQKK